MKSLFTKNKKVMITLFLSFFLIGGNVMAQGQIARWSFSDFDIGANANNGLNPLPVFESDPNLTVGALTRNWTTTATAASAWGGAGFSTTATSVEDAVMAGNYISFTLTANTGYELSLASIGEHNIRRSAAGPSNAQWQFAIGDGVFANIGDAIALLGATVPTTTGHVYPAIPLSGITALQDISAGTVVTIRLVVWGATAAGGNLFLNGHSNGGSLNLVINGEVASDGTTGTPERNAARVVYSTSGQVHFTAAAGEMVQIYNVLGQRIYQGVAIEGANSVVVSSGVALVRVGNTVNKVVVR